MPEHRMDNNVPKNFAHFAHKGQFYGEKQKKNESSIEYAKRCNYEK